MQHLDEGTIHAWIDGELSPEQHGEIAAHVAACPECAAMVAEARGLVAASTRILTALDDVPGGVVPSVPDIAPAQIVRRRWYQRTDIRAAAALLLVAGTSLVVVQRGADTSASRAMLATDDKGQASPVAGAEAAAAGPATGLQRAMADAAPRSAVEPATGQAKPAAPELRTFADPSRRAQAKSDLAVPMDQIAQANARADMPAPRRQARDESRMLKGEASGKRAADVASAQPAAPLARAGVAAPPIVAAPAEDRFGAKAPDVVQGRVIDKKSGKALPGVEVLVEGTTIGASTDKDGNFRIPNVPPGDQRLRVRKLGYEAATIPLAKESRENEAANTVALSSSLTSLEEVVVTSAVTAPAVSTLGAAVSKKTVEAGALRIVRADSTTGGKRTIYEVSKGVQVVLTEVQVETSSERDAAVRQKVAAPRNAPPPTAAPAVQRETAVSGQVSGATVLSAETAQVNTISWTEHGRKYVLTGPVAPKDLEAIRTRLMQMKR